MWLTEVARLLPEILIERPTLPRPGPLTEDWQRLRLFKALAHALLQGHSSLLLFIEDLQWCDRDTLTGLHSANALRPVQWVIVGTVRTDDCTTTGTECERHLPECQLTEIEQPLTESGNAGAGESRRGPSA
jgi:hypothetical protein